MSWFSRLRKRVLRALGFHVCDFCETATRKPWERARFDGWCCSTWSGPDGSDSATFCPECWLYRGDE